MTTATSTELRAADFQMAMDGIRDAHACNQRLNAAGVTYNVWMARGGGRCLRCGSSFEGHRCHVVGSPTEAHRLAQPTQEQEALW